MLLPTSELVAVTWLKGIAYLNNLVATDLPADATTWAASGFTRVGPVVGGSPSLDYALANPVVTLDFFANAPDAGRPPWGKANQLAEQVRRDLLTHGTVPRALVLPAAYDNARCTTAYPVTEPRKIRADEAGFARYTMDVVFSWVVVPK